MEKRNLKIHNKSDKPDNIVLRDNNLIERCIKVENKLPKFMKDYFIYLKGSVAVSTRVAYLEDIYFFCSYLVETKEITKADKVCDITVEEFNQANALSIGIIRLIWPDTDRSKNKESECGLFENIELKKEDFTNENFTTNGRLKKSTLNTIKMQMEMFRARSIQFRQSNIIGEISKYAKTQEKNIIQLDNYLQIKENVDILIIPTLGIPNSENFNSARKFLDEPHNKKQLYLLYDNRNILKSWLNYLDWINKYNIPIKTVKVSNLEELGW